eukprot:4468093-Amphidinium_carterae.1
MWDGAGCLQWQWHCSCGGRDVHVGKLGKICRMRIARRCVLILGNLCLDVKSRELIGLIAQALRAFHGSVACPPSKDAEHRCAKER